MSDMGGHPWMWTITTHDNMTDIGRANNQKIGDQMES